MTIRGSTLKNREVRQRVMTIRHSTLLVSWYEDVYHRVFWGERYCELYEKMRDFYVFFFQNKLEVTAVKKLKKAKNKFVRVLAK